MSAKEWETALIIGAMAGTTAATVVSARDNAPKPPHQPAVIAPKTGGDVQEQGRQQVFDRLNKMKRATLLSGGAGIEPLLKKSVLGAG